MLKPAILYETELQKKNYESWYDTDNMYWHSGCGEFKILIYDDTSSRHQFVSVDKNNNCYYVGIDFIDESEEY